MKGICRTWRERAQTRAGRSAAGPAPRRAEPRGRPGRAGAGLLALALGALLLAAGCDALAPGKGPSSLLPPDAVVLDLDEVARALGKDEALREQLRAAGEQLSSRLSEFATELRRKLEAERQKLGENPGPEATQQLQRMAAQAQLQMRRGQELVRRRAQQLQSELVARFRSEVRPFAEQIARERGARLVLLRTNVLWFDPASDITQAVIDRIRASQPAPADSGSEGASEAPPREQEGGSADSRPRQ